MLCIKWQRNSKQRKSKRRQKQKQSGKAVLINTLSLFSKMPNASKTY